MIEIPLSEAQFAAAQKALAEKGVDLSAPSGTISQMGVTAAYTWAEGLLTIQVTDKPAFFPVSMIEAKLKAWIEERLQAVAG